MYAYRYSVYILGSAQVSLQPRVGYLLETPRVKSVTFQVFGESAASPVLGLCASVLAFLSGRIPAQIVKTNRRYKNQFISGSKVRLGPYKSTGLVARLRALLFYYVPDFRGVSQPLCNPSIAMKVEGLDYIRGMGDTMFSRYYGVDPAGLSSYLTISMGRAESSALLPRALRFPALQDVT